MRFLSSSSFTALRAFQRDSVHRVPRTRSLLPTATALATTSLQDSNAFSTTAFRASSVSSSTRPLPTVPSSSSPIKPEHPIGVSAAIAHAESPSTSKPPHPQIFSEFSLAGRVAVVTGGDGGLGLEMAMALVESGCKVYCLDLPKKPSKDFEVVQEYVKKMKVFEKDGKTEVEGSEGKEKLVYINADVTDQKAMWDIVEKIGDQEGRVDVCVAAAGILQGYPCLEYPAKEFSKVFDVNTSGVLYSAQAAGRQMSRFGIKGSIILIASMSGSITNKDHDWVAYNSSKSAVLQMGRSLACALGEQGIRVNTLSPGHIYTKMTAAFLDKQPELKDKWSSLNPLGRLGEVHEMRGVTAWLASDASTYCTGSDIIVCGGHHSW